MIRFDLALGSTTLGARLCLKGMLLAIRRSAGHGGASSVSWGWSGGWVLGFSGMGVPAVAQEDSRQDHEQ